jgi:hypothetical protein
MDRRGFLIQTARAGSVLLVLPAGWTVAGCGNSASSNTVPGAPAATPTANSLRFTSQVVENHTHDFSIATADLNAPPTNGISGPTTTTLGHFHTVILAPAQLATIEAGGTVNMMTTVTDGHAHNFVFSLAAAEGTGTTPSTTGTGSDAGADSGTVSPNPTGTGTNGTGVAPGTGTSGGGY